MKRRYSLSALSMALCVGGYTVSAEGAVVPDGTASEAPDQFLTLPVHPDPQADGNGSVDNFNTNGIYRRGSHYIWQAPLRNGLPPGMTREAPIPSPAEPAPLATPSGEGSTSSTDLVTVSSDGASYHGETGATSVGDLIVAGSNRIYPGECGTQNCSVVAYVSKNGGSSWQQDDMPKAWKKSPGSALTTFGITFDPALTHDTAGNVYYVFGGAPLSGNYPNSIAVAKREKGTGNWGDPVAVTYNSKSAFDDKYWIAADNSGSSYTNRLYVVWDRNVATNQILYVSYSSNGGSSWSAPIKVDDGKTKFERVIGAYASVDPNNGTVYVSWHNYAKNQIMVDKSTNGGVSWGTDVVAATTHSGFGKDLGCNGGRKQSPAHHLVVGPSGALHLVYADDVSGRGYDILYKKSTDGGVTWSGPVTLNDDGSSAHQYHPALSVSSNGTGGDIVTVSFYDRREDSANCSTQVYATRSQGTGATWSTNIPVTTTASNFDGNANGPGDYSSSTAASTGDWSFFAQHPSSGSDFDVSGALVTP